MAINYELINKGGISLGTNFELLSEKPLDSRLVVPSLDGLQNYIDSAAAYEGMIAYVSSEKKHYEVKVIDGVLSYRPFGLTEAELNDLITNATTAAMEFKGATATLPENPAKGDMYKVAGENINIKIDDVDAKLGDSIVYDGENWFLIPSGDDIEDTWRPVDGVNNDATLKFVSGDKTVAAVAADGTIKYNHATVAAPTDVTAEGDEKTRTYITAVETDGYGHITGYKTATENVEDTNTTYEFEGQAEESSVYFTATSSEENADSVTVYLDAYSKNETNLELAKKLDANGWTSTSGVLNKTDNYESIDIRAGGITMENTENEHIIYVGNGEVRVGQGMNATFIEPEGLTIHDEGGDSIKITTTSFNVAGNALNYPSASGTLATVEDIAAGNFKIKQTAKAAVETAANTFIDTVAQNENGEITITTKAVDFTDVNNELDKKIESIVISTGDAAGQIKYSVDGAEAINVDVNGFADLKNTVDTNKANWDAGYAHSTEEHAPVDAQANIIESVKVNGEALTITDKAVDITIPTGALADKDEVAKTDLADALATEIDNKVASVAAGDASVTIGGTATAPTVAAKISAAEGNALTLAEDGLKVIIPESTKVEASETNGNIKVDGQEVTVYEHPDKHAIADVDGLQAELNNANGAIETLNLSIGVFETSEGVSTLVEYIDNRDDNVLENAKIEAANKDAVVLAEAQKYADQAEADAVAAAKAEIESLMTWGSF